ncbi:MAG: ABC transporter ATP-binding protein [Lachnospiraceae bacterium]|jgi:ATP-binding cassette subfamily B protein|nr:ABC transporter ATP-binding protein [Lachnospiraceae bacterium]
MKRIKDVLTFFAGLDRGFYPILLLAALLETLEGFGVLLISSTILTQLVAGAGLETILTVTIAMTLGYGILHWLQILVARHKGYRQQRLHYRYWSYVTKQVFQVPYWYLEKEDFVETLGQVRENDRIYNLSMSILDTSYGIARSCFSVLVAFLSFLQLFGAVRGLGKSAFLVGMLILGLFVLIVFSTGYIVWQRKHSAEEMVSFMEVVVKQNKIAMYLLNEVIASYPMGKHIRIYGMQERLRQEGEKENACFKDLVAHQNRMEVKPRVAGDLSSVAISGMIYLTVSAVAMAGGLEVGSIIWYAGVVQQLLESVRQLVGQASELYGYCTRQQVIFGLTKAVQEVDSGEQDLPCGENHTLEFEDVSFAYPGSERMVLEHVNMRLSDRERVALVGRNGSGKSTLIKLICRLYEPSEGRILLDGVDIREISREAYMDFLSVVFQDYQIFAATLGENIAMKSDADKGRVEEAIGKIGLKLTEQDMPLRRDLEADGVEVSGGEGQKIAIARALYKDAPMVILDEPTAALDPFSESEIYEKFGTLVEGKLAMFISHRLSSCRFCDRILVLQDGKIVQDGSHEVLAGQEGGLYREMWEAQRQYYV